MNTPHTTKSAFLFSFDGRPSLGQSIPLGLQHVVSAVVGVITPAIMIGKAAQVSTADEVLLMQACLLFTALATLLQLFPVWRIGSRLPVIMGTSFAYVPTMLSIATTFGLPALFGAQLIGGLVAILFGIFVKRLRRFFPALITGTVIFTIGLSLYPTAIRYMAGGAGNPTFGSPQNWMIALLTLAVVIFCNFFTKGTAKLASILLGIFVGYGAALLMGLISFDKVSNAPYFHIVSPLHFSLSFPLGACLSMAVMFIINSVQSIGDFTSTTMGGMNRLPTDQELSGGIVGQGVASMAGSLFGALPTATYSQNVGIVTVTRVVNRVVFTLAAMILLVAGLVPKFAALLTTIPESVIGGATLSVFASITMTGLRMIASQPLTPRNVTVVGLAVALGVGINSVPGCIDGFPNWFSSMFGASSVVVAALVAILLNSLLPKDITIPEK